MMMNLFSVFDPSSSIMSLSWLMIIMLLTILPMKLWNNSAPNVKTLKKINFMFKKEVSFSLGKTEKSTELMIMLIFFSIISMNVLALYPQIFSPSSHLAVNLPMALTFWLALIIFGWAKNTSHMMIHLVPQGTPSALMLFMVLIELTSNIIRPITLCVRLTANMIAGHLLMTLLGNFFMNNSIVVMFTLMPMPLILTILESAVACIQAYVFMTLVTLYTSELK